MDLRYRTDLVRELVAAGYVPLPIKPKDKTPTVSGWQAPDYTPPAEIKFSGHSIGIACGRGEFPVAGIDIDVVDEALANEMREYVDGVLGVPAMYRIGRAPKILIVCRYNLAGARKRMSLKYSCGRVEILGGGQYFVAAGTHPDTGKEYYWPKGSIFDTPASALPVVTDAQIGQIIAHFEELAQARGHEPLSQKHSLAGAPDDYDPDDPLDSSPPVGLTIDDAVRKLKTLDPDCGREEWIQIGMALHHEFGGSDEAAQAWADWSAGGSKFKEGEPERQWESFGNYTGRPITGKYLLKLTKGEEKPEEDNFFKKLNWSTTRFLDQPPELPMVIDGFLPRGIVATLYSAGGAGKSTIALNMAVKIALAKDYDSDFLGRAVTGGRVVILTAEDPELILNRRFIGTVTQIAEEFGIDHAEALASVAKYLSIVSTFGHSVQLFKLKVDGTLAVTKHYESFLDCLRERPNLQLVIVDTKTRYSPAEGLGNVTITQEVTFYEHMAKVTGASVLLLHHTNKTSRDGSQSGSQSYRDATAFFDCVRAAWYLRGCTAPELEAQGITDDAPGKYLLLENAKNNYLPVCAPVILERNNYKFTSRPFVNHGKVSAKEKEERKKQAAYDKVVEVMQGLKGRPIQADLLRQCSGEGVSRARVLDALRDLQEDELVEASTVGRSRAYGLTEQGKLYNLTIKGEVT